MNRVRECCFKTVPEDGRRLVWEITHACRFNCDYCFQARKRINNPMRVLNENDLLLICDKLHELRIKDVLITGGEIFHAKDVLGLVCASLKKAQISLSFSTAHIFQKDFISLLFSFHPKAFNISLDPKSSFQTGKTWENYLEATEYILQMGDMHEVPVKITGVINRDNVVNFDEYLGVVKKMCRKHKSLSAVYVTNPYDIGYVKSNVRASEDELAMIVTTVSAKRVPRSLRLVNFPRHNAPLQRCLAGSHYLVLEPNGNIYPCHLFANYNKDVFLMGNILHEPVAEIEAALTRFSDQVNQAVERYKKEIVSCKKCTVAGRCGGGCLAELISVGQLIEPQLICKFIQSPRKVGRFKPVRQKTFVFEGQKDLTEKEEQGISDYVSSNIRRREHDLAHGFDHIKCVVRLARFIAKKENANLRIVTAAAYFHDFAPRQELLFESHTTLSAEKAVQFLKKLGFRKSELSEIYLCIDTSSYGAAQLGQEPDSIEAKVVRDADWLDAIGARGIARVFAFAASHGCEVLGEVEWDPANPQKKRTSLVGPDPSPIYHFFSKLLWVRNGMKTPTGQRLAEKRHTRLVRFLEEYRSEMNPESFNEA